MINSVSPNEFSIFLIFFKSFGKNIALGDWLNLNILLPNPFILNIPWFNLPHCANWTIPLLAIGIYGLFTMTLGLVSSFLQWNLCRSFTTIVRITVTSLVAPAMLEEIVFRGWLLPDLGDNLLFDTYIPRVILSLFLFIVYHPLNALTLFPQGRETFFDPIFLTLAAALIHWLTVVIWLLCFGGLAKLKFSPERS